VGVPLRDLVHPTSLSLPELKGKKLSLDAYNMLYQFLASIRQPDGEPFTDPSGHVTSHLVGLLYRTASLLENGVLPVYVFDGKPSDLKAGTLRQRALAKERAARAWEEALAEGDLEKARRKAAGTSRLTPEMVSDARRLLDALGVPHLLAPSEGEAQAVHMAREGKVWSAASEDYDTLLFGTPRLIRGLGASRGSQTTLELLETPRVLEELGISQDELILLGMLVGTDFNEGVRGIGPKKALKLVRQHLGLEGTLRSLGLDPGPYQEVFELFHSPAVTDGYELRWRRPDLSMVEAFLVKERGFDPQRVSRALQRIPTEAPSSGNQLSLEAFGGRSA
jgi:flap endonuclease-1